MIHLNQLALPTHPENDIASWPACNAVESSLFVWHYSRPFILLPLTKYGALSLQAENNVAVFFIDFRWKFTQYSEKCITQSRKCYKNHSTHVENTQMPRMLHPNPGFRIKSWDEIKKLIIKTNMKMASKWVVSFGKVWCINGWIFLESI